MGLESTIYSFIKYKSRGFTGQSEPVSEGGAFYLDIIGCQVSFHVAVLLFGRWRGWLVGRWKVSPVKRVKR